VALEPVTSPARIFTLVLTVGVSLLLLIPIGAAAQIVLTSQIEDETTTQVIVVMDPRVRGITRMPLKMNASNGQRSYMPQG
jgi:hypothetical protein